MEGYKVSARGHFALRSVPSLAVLCATASLLLGNCARFDRAKQVRTYADMQTIVAELDERLSLDQQPLDESEVSSVIASVSNGEDSWGSPFLYRYRKTSSGFDYILVSLGSDRALDVVDVDVYFGLAEETIAGRTERDLVFRDGLPVTRAGK